MYHNYPKRGLYYSRYRDERQFILSFYNISLSRQLLLKRERRMIRLLLYKVIPRILTRLRSIIDRALVNTVVESLISIYNCDQLMRHLDRGTTPLLFERSYDERQLAYTEG